MTTSNRFEDNKTIAVEDYRLNKNSIQLSNIVLRATGEIDSNPSSWAGPGVFWVRSGIKNYGVGVAPPTGSTPWAPPPSSLVSISLDWPR